MNWSRFILRVAFCLLLTVFSPFLENRLIGAPSDDSYQEGRKLRFWGEIYDESMTFQKDRNNFCSISHFRAGLRIPLDTHFIVETYFFMRYGRDVTRDFWNNKFEEGLGIRFRYSKGVFIASYLEGVRGFYTDIPETYPQSDSKEYSDFRSGLIFWYGWDRYYEPSRLVSFPMIFWGETYSDISYYRFDRHNVIGYFHTKSGIHLLRFWKFELDGYGVLYALKDSNQDFWNNLVEFGPGVRFSPVQGLFLKFFAEWIWGTYFGIEGIEPNPYAQKYTDRRVGVLFWIGW